MNNCPCGSGKDYSACCEPVISGTRSAETAEQLMRARYTAYTLVQTDFLYQSTHPGHRKGYDHDGTREWAENSEWQGLEIVAVEKGGTEDAVGTVEFVARFSEKGVSRSHHECASFIREKGSWYFTDGRLAKSRPVTVVKIGRNDPCSCGSGLKYKKCCGK